MRLLPEISGSPVLNTRVAKLEECSGQEQYLVPLTSHQKTKTPITTSTPRSNSGRIEAADCPMELFFAVLFKMGFHRLLSVSSGVNHMASSYVSMVRSFLMTSGLMMLGRFPVVASGMGQMF